MDQPESFGYLVRRRRKILDLTQDDLARRVGCSLATIQKIEVDLRRPSKQVAELLAKALEIQVGEAADFIRLARAVRSQSGGLSAPAEPLSNLRKSGACPRLLTSFIGREQEISWLQQLLQSLDCQLITLFGPGGIGKTRLAMQLAHQVSSSHPDRFADGSCFVPLASVSAVDLVPATIAASLDLPLSNQRAPKDQVIHYLEKRRLLLVLDNMEQLLDGANLVMEILQSAPGVKILVTSRERLKLQSEWVFEVQGLPVPTSGQQAGLELNSSVALFLERARHLQPEFALNPQNALNIARICRLVEGIPLGIELAATWVRVLSVEEIAQEIERDLDFLITSSLDVPPRQRSFRAVFNHSWELLSLDEQRVMRQLAIFRGGFQREAAAKVAGASVGQLSGLMDKTLLRRAQAGRYSMHELVAQYALQHLAQDSAEETAAHHRHSDYYLHWVKDREASLVDERQKQARDELSAEIDNIRAAWDWAVAHQQFELIRGAAIALFRYHEFTNTCHEGESLFHRALQAYEATLGDLAVPPPAGNSTLGVFLGHLAFLTFRIGQTEKAIVMIERSLALLYAYGSIQDRAEVLWHMGSAYWFAGRYQEALSLSREGLAIYTELGWKWEAAVQEICIGGVLYCLGEFPESLRVLKHALAVSRLTREPRLIATAIGILCRALEVSQQYQEMEALLEEAASISRQNRDQFALGMALERLAAATLGASPSTEAEAVRLLQESASIFREVGDGWSLAHTLNHLARLHLQLGQTRQALLVFEDAYQTALGSQVAGYAMDARLGIAEIKMIEGDLQEAGRLASEVLANPSTAIDSRLRAEQILKGISGEEIPLMTDQMPSLENR